MTIKLAWFEMAVCASVGIRRRIEALRRGLKDRPDFKRDFVWTADIEGACGEMAAAKALGRYWDGSVNTFHRGDVGKLQVRTALIRPLLIVRKNNNRADTFILVSGRVPNYEVIGWIRGKDAMQKKYLRKPDPTRPEVYAIPPEDLKPLEELP